MNGQRWRVCHVGLRLATCGLVNGFREPEVQDFGGAIGAKLDIRRLQIAMDDALLVCSFEGFGDLARDRDRKSVV